MKKVVINVISRILLLYLSSLSLIQGQSELNKTPFQIDIKRNFGNIKVVNLSKIGKELTYVPLETTSACLIQQIKKILLSDSYIFISEFNKLLQFDKNGKFIRQIGSSGSGPGEYLSIGDFCIDELKKEIYIIFSSAPKLLIFSFDGIFKTSLNLSFRPAQIILKDQNSFMFHFWNVPGANDPSWIITNKQVITLTTINNSLKRISQPGFLINHTPLYSFDKTIHFMEFGIDTLYYFKNKQKKPYAVFYLDDLKMDTDPLITTSLLKDKKLLNKFWIGSIIENNEYFFIKFFRGISTGTLCAIYNKTTNAVTFLQDDVFKNDLGGGIGFWPKLITDDNFLVDYVDAFDLLKGIIPSSLRSKLTETSNPVLVILK